MTIAAAVMVAVIPGMTPVGEPPIGVNQCFHQADCAFGVVAIRDSLAWIGHLDYQLAVYAPSQLAGRQPLRCRCLCTRLPVVRARLSGLDHRLQHRWRHHRSVMRVPAQEQK